MAALDAANRYQLRGGQLILLDGTTVLATFVAANEDLAGSIWLVTGYLVALAAEWGSINHGIPFGYYTYHYEALEHDLVVFGVPFFDSLSFVFLSYASFSFAQFLLSPHWCRGFNVQRVTSRDLRNSVAVLFVGASFMVVPLYGPCSISFTLVPAYITTRVMRLRPVPP